MSLTSLLRKLWKTKPKLVTRVVGISRSLFITSLFVMIFNEINVFVSNTPRYFFHFKDTPVYPPTSSIPRDEVAGDIIGKFLVLFPHFTLFPRVAIFHYSVVPALL